MTGSAATERQRARRRRLSQQGLAAVTVAVPVAEVGALKTFAAFLRGEAGEPPRPQIGVDLLASLQEAADREAGAILSDVAMFLQAAPPENRMRFMKRLELSKGDIAMGAINQTGGR